MKKILIFAFALLVCSLSAQVNNIYRSGGISQTVGAPTFKPGASGNIVAIDTVTGIWYISRDRYSVNWLSMGYRIENISGCSAPAYTPNKMNSTLVINSCSPPEMYAYNGATWEQVAGGGGGGGGLTTEQVQDIVAAMLVDGDGITTGYSDVDGLITVTNTGDLSATNELNTAFSVTSGNLRITDAGGNKDVAITSVAPIQSLVSGTGISVTGAGSAKTITSTITQADGSETKVNAGIGISVSGIGTTGSPYVIASTTTGTTDLSFSGASSPVTLNSSTGTDVTITAGTGIGLASTSGNMTVTNSAPDQTVSITGAGITAITGTYPNFTATSTEVDGSISNEGSLTVTAGSGTTSVIHSNTSGASDVTLTASTGLSISENTGTGTITLTNSLPDQTVTISSGAGISATGTYPNFTVASTITQYTDENAQDAIGAMAGNTLTYTDATPLLDVKTQMSITSDASGVKLSGDASTPGATMLYGTNSGGTKGWYAQPSGGGGGSDYLGTGFTSGGGSGTFPDGTHAALNDAFSTFYIDYSPGGQAAIAFEPDAAGGMTFYSPSGQSTIGLYDGIGVQVTGSYPFYIPLFTTSGKNALSPSEGAIVGDFTTKKLNYYNGTSWSQFEPLPTLGTSLQQIRVNSGGTALEYFTPSSLGITDLTGDVTATGPGSVAATISSFAVTSAKIANNAVNGTKIAMTGDTQGDVLYYDGTDYVRLPPGTSGQFLQTLGTGANPVWGTPSGSGDIANGGNTTGAAITIGTNDAFGLNLETNNVTRVSITGAASTGGAITQDVVTANTSTVENAMTIRTNSIGTAAAGFGARHVYQLESSTTDNRDAAAIGALWTTATDASRTSALTFSTLTAAGPLTERMRISGAGNVGIGTTSPTYPMHITIGNTTSFSGLSVASYVTSPVVTRMLIESTAAAPNAGFVMAGSGVLAWTAAAYKSSGTNLSFTFYNEVLARAGLFIRGDNNQVGINTDTPTGSLSVTQTATATGALKGVVYTGAVNTNQTLSTEIPAVTITTAGRQWATGALTTQREVLITAPTYSFVGASTITDAATLGISGAPIKSTNATITNTHGLLIQAGSVSTATNSYGISVNAQTGATNNYAAQFIGGNVGIGTAAPTEALQVAGNIKIETAGKGIQLQTGTGQRFGNATLVAGTVTVTNTTVGANTYILLTRKTSGGTIGTSITYTISNGASFTINSDNPLDTSTFTYFIFEGN